MATTTTDKKELVDELADDLETLILQGGGATVDQLHEIYKKVRPKKKLEVPGVGYNVPAEADKKLTLSA